MPQFHWHLDEITILVAFQPALYQGEARGVLAGQILSDGEPYCKLGYLQNVIDSTFTSETRPVEPKLFTKLRIDEPLSYRSESKNMHRARNFYPSGILSRRDRVATWELSGIAWMA
jgi:hypothetical protein